MSKWLIWNWNWLLSLFQFFRFPYLSHSSYTHLLPSPTLLSSSSPSVPHFPQPFNDFECCIRAQPRDLIWAKERDMREGHSVCTSRMLSNDGGRFHSWKCCCIISSSCRDQRRRPPVHNKTALTFVCYLKFDWFYNWQMHSPRLQKV